MYKLSLIVFFLIISFSGFSQIDTFETNKTYKVIAIDSTENNYVIFVSSNLWDTLSNVDIPFLLKKDECNYYLIYHYDNTNQYCIVSPKINGLNRNISIGEKYNLSLNCITDKTLNEVNIHIGYGDYILQYPTNNLYTAKEIVGLLHEENIDSLSYYFTILYQMKLFDSEMFYIWMNLNKQSNICYSLWLNKQIKQIKPIYLSFDEDIIILYQNEDCNIPDTTIRREDYHKNGMLKANLIFKYKNTCFVQISTTTNIIYGWIRGGGCVP